MAFSRYLQLVNFLHFPPATFVHLTTMLSQLPCDFMWLLRMQAKQKTAEKLWSDNYFHCVVFQRVCILRSWNLNFSSLISICRSEAAVCLVHSIKIYPASGAAPPILHCWFSSYVPRSVLPVQVESTPISSRISSDEGSINWDNDWVCHWSDVLREIRSQSSCWSVVPVRNCFQKHDRSTVKWEPLDIHSLSKRPCDDTE